MNLTNPNNLNPLTAEALNEEMITSSLLLPFFPQKKKDLLEKGPLFVPISGDTRFPMPQYITQNMSLEIMKRDKIMTTLRKGNKELERILASLKVPKLEEITRGRTTHLTFEEISSEISIVLIPKETTLLDLEIVPSNPIIGSFYKTKISQLSKKMKRPDSHLHKGKGIQREAQDWELPLIPMINCII